MEVSKLMNDYTMTNPEDLPGRRFKVGKNWMVAINSGQDWSFKVMYSRSSLVAGVGPLRIMVARLYDLSNI